MAIASIMDTRASALGSDPDFKPPSTFYEILTTPTSLPSMNYSPKHSRKPSSLLSSRNINMKNLLLNLSPSTNSSTTLPPRRGKPLALAIPQSLLPAVATHHLGLIDPVSLSAPHGMTTPLNLSHNASFEAPVSRFLHLLPTSVSDMSQEYLPDKLDMNLRNSMLQSPFGSSGTSAGVLKDNLDEIPVDLGRDFRNPPSSSHTLKPQSPQYRLLDPRVMALEANPPPQLVPEELQEQSNLHAYPYGPANVLNSILYLYSDPRDSDRIIDINDYDLVINVARECPNLAKEFDTTGGKQYMYIPWSHTSSILKELPKVTAAIARYDVPGKKILVHCQCGVLRSACVIVAYFMVKFRISVNEAYELLKSGTGNITDACNQKIAGLGNTVTACERICPNMSLIFELMDFGERLETKWSPELSTQR